MTTTKLVKLNGQVYELRPVKNEKANESESQRFVKAFKQRMQELGYKLLKIAESSYTLKKGAQKPCQRLFYEGGREYVLMKESGRFFRVA